MNNITRENRRESYEDILGKAKTRQEICLETLIALGGEATANEITYELFTQEVIEFYDTNYVKPRLNELMKFGKITPIGKKKDKFTGKSCTIYTIKNNNLN
jgi:hypothetical protein